MPDQKASYFVIASEDFLESLRRCANGEDPDLVLMEFYVNCDHENIEGDES